MKRGRIKVTLYNRTLKEIDMSDFSYISEDIFSNRSDFPGFTGRNRTGSIY